MPKVLVIGGYGNAGRRIVELLAEWSDLPIVVAGRRADRAQELADTVNAAQGAHRVGFLGVDAGDRVALTRALAPGDLLVAASSTSGLCEQTAGACVEASAHYLDIQVSSSKVQRLRAMAGRFAAAGVCAVSDAGFHPGLPAAMVRHVAASRPGLRSARVASVIASDWSQWEFSEATIPEFVEEVRDFRYEEYREGSWRRAKGSLGVDFPEPFGRRACSAMGLAEMHELTGTMPALRDTGFYVGGFNPVVDRAILPVAWVGLKLPSRQVERQLGRLLAWGLRTFSRPPYGTILQLDSQGTTLMRVAHPDAYFLTAAPAVACAWQMLDGTIGPGLHLQGCAVQTDRFFADLGRMGVSVEAPRT